MTTVGLSSAPPAQQPPAGTRFLSLAPFSALCTQHRGNLYWLPAPESGFTCDSPMTDDYLRIESTDQRLWVRTASANGSMPLPKLLLSGPTLNYLELQGNGSFIALKPLSVGELWIELMGAGDLQIEVQTDSLRLRILGSGNAIIKGKTSLFDLKTIGAGDVRAGQLSAQRVLAEIEGSGKVDLRPMEYLRLDMKSSGDVRLFSRPLCDINIIGAGQLLYQ